jgi:MFS family permease
MPSTPLAQPPNTTSTGGCLHYRSAAAARRATTAALTATFIIEKADEAILPSTYAFIGAALGATPAQLGNISLARALAQAATAPIAGVLGDRLDRPRIVAFAAVAWGVMTVAMGLMTSVSQAVAFSVINGIGLSLLIPSVQSIIADYYEAGSRGRAFGTLYLVSSLGSMAGGFFATTVGGKKVGTLAGWRFAFLLIAAASVVVGLFVLLFAADPRSAAKKEAAARRTDKGIKASAAWVRARLAGMARDVRLVLAIPTFRIIVAQGIVGSMPWTAMGFWTVYLQLLGFPDVNAATIVAGFSLGCAAGSYIGGAVGDWAHKRWPAWGRVASCQACVAASLPLAFLLTKGLPAPTILGNAASATAAVAAVPRWMVPAWAAAFAGAGSLMSWCGTSNSAIFAEVVPECLRSSIYAFDRSFETAIGALAGPIVGVLASRVFGFRGALKVDPAAPADLIAHNARALGNAILAMLVTPWAFCLLFYTGLYWYLPRDRVAAAALAERLAAEAAAARVEKGAVVVGEGEEGDDDDAPSSSSSGDDAFMPPPPGKTVA